MYRDLSISEADLLPFKTTRGLMKHLIARILHWFIIASMVLAGCYLALMSVVLIVG